MKIWCLILLLLTAPFVSLVNQSALQADRSFFSKNAYSGIESQVFTQNLALDLKSKATLDSTETRYLQNLERAYEHGPHFAWLLAEDRLCLKTFNVKNKKKKNHGKQVLL